MNVNEMCFSTSLRVRLYRINIYCVTTFLCTSQIAKRNGAIQLSVQPTVPTAVGFLTSFSPPMTVQGVSRTWHYKIIVQ